MKVQRLADGSYRNKATGIVADSVNGLLKDASQYFDIGSKVVSTGRNPKQGVITKIANRNLGLVEVKRTDGSSQVYNVVDLKLR